MKKLLIHEFKTPNNDTVKLEREQDDNYVINTYDFLGNYIEKFSRNIVKYEKEPSLKEFEDFYYESILTERF